MKIVITIFVMVTLSLVTFQVFDEFGSDDVSRFALIIGVAHLICFQTWIVKKWWALDTKEVNTGLWLISLINVADIAACTYAFFDLSIISSW